MRNVLILLVACGAMAFASACDVAGGDSDATTDTTTPDNGTPDSTGDADTTPTVQYFGVGIVDLLTADNCSTNQKAHGADIDAVELEDNGNSLAYFNFVQGEIGDASVCADAVGSQHTNFDEATGPPDGTLSDGYVALGGGYLVGEFEGALEIVDAYTINTYEVGTIECGNQGCKDEPYEVYLATDADCDPTAGGCSVLLSDQAAGHATIPVSPF